MSGLDPASASKLPSDRLFKDSQGFDIVNQYDGVRVIGNYRPGTAPGAAEKEPPAGTGMGTNEQGLAHGDAGPYQKCVPGLKSRGVLTHSNYNNTKAMEWTVQAAPGYSDNASTWKTVVDVLGDGVGPRAGASFTDFVQYQNPLFKKDIEHMLKNGVELPPWYRDGPIAFPDLIKKYCTGPAPAKAAKAAKAKAKAKAKTKGKTPRPPRPAKDSAPASTLGPEPAPSSDDTKLGFATIDTSAPPAPTPTPTSTPWWMAPNPDPKKYPISSNKDDWPDDWRHSWPQSWSFEKAYNTQKKINDQLAAERIQEAKQVDTSNYEIVITLDESQLSDPNLAATLEADRKEAADRLRQKVDNYAYWTFTVQQCKNEAGPCHDVDPCTVDWRKWKYTYNPTVARSVLENRILPNPRCSAKSAAAPSRTKRVPKSKTFVGRRKLK